MPERATIEFWRDLKPITDVFKPDAKPEACVANAPTDDERYYVPFTDTVSSRPLWISPSTRRRARATRWSPASTSSRCACSSS